MLGKRQWRLECTNSNKQLYGRGRLRAGQAACVACRASAARQAVAGQETGIHQARARTRNARTRSARTRHQS